jgi:hypothetical protein
MTLLETVIAPGVQVEVPPREYLRNPPTFREPPYRSNIAVPSNPVDQISP